MKIRDLILVVLVIGMVISTGTLVIFASNGISEVKGITSDASSGELLANASKNLEAVAISIRNALDNNMENQYEMVKLWAREPTLLEVAQEAEGYTVEELYEMWSAELTRRYVDNEAVGSGDPNDDISPTVSKYLAQLTRQSLFTEIFITDSRGYIIAASGPTSDFDQGPDNYKIVLENGVPTLIKDNPNEFGEDWYKAAKESPSRFYVSTVTWDESSGISGVEIVRQLRNPTTEKYLGMMKAVYNYGAFLDKFVNEDELGVYEVKVVDADGRIIATSLDDKTKIDNPDVNISNQPGFTSALAISHGNIPQAYTDENGESVFAGFSKSSGDYGFIVMVTKKADVMAGPVDKFVDTLQSAIGEKGSALQRNMIIIGAVVAIVILAIAFLIMRAKVSIPLKKLTAISDKLSNGEIEGLVIDVHGKDEISSFGEHFKGVLAAFNFLKDEAESKK